MTPMWKIRLEGLFKRFAAWRAETLLRKAKALLARAEWWRRRAGGECSTSSASPAWPPA